MINRDRVIGYLKNINTNELKYTFIEHEEIELLKEDKFKLILNYGYDEESLPTTKKDWTTICDLIETIVYQKNNNFIIEEKQMLAAFIIDFHRYLKKIEKFYDIIRQLNDEKCLYLLSSVLDCNEYLKQSNSISFELLYLLYDEGKITNDIFENNFGINFPYNDVDTTTLFKLEEREHCYYSNIYNFKGNKSNLQILKENDERTLDNLINTIIQRSVILRKTKKEDLRQYCLKRINL